MSDAHQKPVKFTKGAFHMINDYIRRGFFSLGVAMLLAAPNARADASFSGLTVEKVGVANTTGAEIGYVIFNVTALPGSSVCSNADNMMSFDLATAKGKAILSVLTAALLSGKKVNGRGLSTCQNVTIGATTFAVEPLT